MTFRSWLLAQRERSDLVGFLAECVEGDTYWPHGMQSLRDHIEYMQSTEACDIALRTMERAWGEYVRSLLPDVPIRGFHFPTYPDPAEMTIQ
jgi:uncharacterized protein YozE (UPF0346 family)